MSHLQKASLSPLKGQRYFAARTAIQGRVFSSYNVIGKQKSLEKQ